MKYIKTKKSVGKNKNVLQSERNGNLYITIKVNIKGIS